MTEVTKEQIYTAFGLTPADVEELEATPAFQSYQRARADADAAYEAFLKNARAIATRVSADLTEHVESSHLLFIGGKVYCPTAKARIDLGLNHRYGAAFTCPGCGEDVEATRP